jgi:hypothetical protein
MNLNQFHNRINKNTLIQKYNKLSLQCSNRAVIPWMSTFLRNRPVEIPPSPFICRLGSEVLPIVKCTSQIMKFVSKTETAVGVERANLVRIMAQLTERTNLVAAGEPLTAPMPEFVELNCLVP